MGTFQDPIVHYFNSGLQVAQNILVEHLDIIGLEAHQVDYFTSPNKIKIHILRMYKSKHPCYETTQKKMKKIDQ